MSTREWALLVLALANSIGTILAWSAKLLWSREYAAAKDEVIRAKDEQIETVKAQLENLREMTPMRIREYLLSITQTMEEYNDRLKEQLNAAQREIVERQQSIERHKEQGQTQSFEITRLQTEKAELSLRTAALEKEVDKLRHSESSPLVFGFQRDIFPKIGRLSSDLAEVSSKPTDVTTISILSNTLYNNYFGLDRKKWGEIEPNVLVDWKMFLSGQEPKQEDASEGPKEAQDKSKGEKDSDKT